MAGRKRKYGTEEERKRAQYRQIEEYHKRRAAEDKFGMGRGELSPKGRKAKPGEARITRRPSFEQIDELVKEMVGAGERPPSDGTLGDWIRSKAEPDLYWFNRWIILSDPAYRLKLGAVHREMCRFLTDFTSSRRKLLMLPMGHLKTSHASQALPLHIIVQRAERNIYFPGKDGREMRGLLGNENTEKCVENLSVVRKHLEENLFIAWLWPEVCWENPLRDSPRWTNQWIEVPRKIIVSEPTVTAIGADSGIFGRHYDWQVLDDIAGLKAGESYDVMRKAKRFKAGCDTRFHSRAATSMCIQIGVGTHQGADDVYVDWLKQPDIDPMVRAIEEGGKALWPEEFSLEDIETLRKSTDPIHWALWYMNKPVSSQYTALDWASLREFWFDTEPSHWLFNEVRFEDHQADVQLEIRKAAMTANPLMKLAQGVPLTQVPGNRALMLKRYFGKGSMSDAQANYLREKYPEREQKH